MTPKALNPHLFYKDLNRGPKNIWKLQTRKWWDPVNPSANFPTSFGLGRNQVTETGGGVVITNEVLKCPTGTLVKLQQPRHQPRSYTATQARVGGRPGATDRM